MAQDENENVSVILWQLQQYQHIIRKWDRSLDPYEFKVVMQVLDRTIGWQRLEATFRPYVMMNGDRMYSGFGRTMHRSKLMKVLSQLEKRGVLRREPDEYRPGLKSYSLNLDWEPEEESLSSVSELDHGSVENARKTVSTGDGVVSNTDYQVSTEDISVSVEDPREEYQENPINTGNLENNIRVDPSPPAADQPMAGVNVANEERFPRTRAPSHRTAIVDPPRRKRRFHS